MTKERKVLMVAYHYPPVHGSSGLQRTLQFSKYLVDLGWKPYILTVTCNAYSETSDSLETPDNVTVVRVPTLDSARHLSVFGKYPRAIAMPDRWTSWQLFGKRIGTRIVRKEDIDLIWSTYPIATAHKLANSIAANTGIPWIADFRDSMTEAHYPADKVVRESYRKIERDAIKAANRVVFTTGGTREMYIRRYNEIDEDKFHVIRNGYDEELFHQSLQNRPKSDLSNSQVVLVHSGLLYPKERDPTHFFEAIAKLQHSGLIANDSLKIVLRATGFDEQYGKKILSLGIENVIKLKPSIDYLEALAEMQCASGLLLFQDSCCNHQVPAKLYEYLRANRPILALTDASGDTAQELNMAGVQTIADISSTENIQEVMLDFLSRIKQNRPELPDADYVKTLSRAHQTQELAHLFDEAVRLRV